MGNKKTDFDSLKEDIDEIIKEHDKYSGLDGTLYNSTTILVIVLTSLSALIPIGGEYEVYAKIFSGVAAILISIDRSVSWGERWTYHRQMRHDYLTIRAKISFYENLPEELFNKEEVRDRYKEIYTELENVRKKEIAMPGIR